MNSTALKIEEHLSLLLSNHLHEGEVQRPQRLLDAMKYSVLSGGKRLRPLLIVEAARLFGRDDKGVLIAASALECIHCYSLVHDDLPAMDDDHVRRGRPTAHIQFDEATAILAGDALLTYAFDLIADPLVHPSAEVRLRLSRELSRASGLGGMAGGQMLDLESEHRDRTEVEIRTLQAMKTGALIRYACRAGALLGDAEEADVSRLTRFGEIIGLAFQLADDLLDLKGDSAVVGKATGKDAAAGKATLVGLLGETQTREELNKLINEANDLLSPFGEKGEILRTLAHFIAERDN
ncbi:polyprenyl synthetase family protein [Flexibacterium corallicola]|uniref:polyprenyl synthetase family protein n=1 Tax=Flexibacterium corallicola TaxID=3037259 RepID=UPI00286F960D|nr:farnesyl diphosphate synthase [Pseudovibrio sp. M1P-2-3]